MHQSIPEPNPKQNRPFSSVNAWAVFILFIHLSASWNQSQELALQAPAKWEKDIRVFESEDATKPPAEGGIVFVGSSSIRKWDSLPEKLFGMPVLKRGFGGSELSDCIAFADRIVFPYKPSVVYVYAGDNDMGKGKSPQVVFADFKTLAKMVAEHLPGTKLGFIAIKPSLKRREWMESMNHANQLIADFCSRHDNLGFVDIFTPMLNEHGEPGEHWFVSDGLHLSESGYELWMRCIQDHLKDSNWVMNGS